MLNQKTRSRQVETRAVEECFSRRVEKPLREVPVLSSRAGVADAVLPPTDTPNPLEEAKLHRRTLGLIYGFTQRNPPTTTILRG